MSRHGVILYISVSALAQMLESATAAPRCGGLRRGADGGIEGFGCGPDLLMVQQGVDHVVDVAEDARGGVVAQVNQTGESGGDVVGVAVVG